MQVPGADFTCVHSFSIMKVKVLTSGVCVQDIRRAPLRLDPRPDPVLLQRRVQRRESNPFAPLSYSYSQNPPPLQSLQKNVPSIPSALIANVWSNGDPGWTKGPPTADATATVHYIKAYFNSTSFDEGAFGAQCAAAGGVPACAI